MNNRREILLQAAYAAEINPLLKVEQFIRGLTGEFTPNLLINTVLIKFAHIAITSEEIVSIIKRLVADGTIRTNDNYRLGKRYWILGGLKK